MNKTKRTITVAHPLKVIRMFGSHVFRKTDTGETNMQAGNHGVYREAATAAQAARLSLALGYGWSSNPRNPSSRTKVAA